MLQLREALFGRAARFELVKLGWPGAVALLDFAYPMTSNLAMVSPERESALGCIDGDDMSWAVPPKDVRDVNRAGRELAKRRFPMEADDVLQTVNHWRSSHAYPLNTFQMGLRRRAVSLDPAADVVQRIKRLESIHSKLVRDQTNTMRLSQMQDIAGCRAVLLNKDQVFQLVEKYKNADKRFLHELKNDKNYISNPKSDGYRGVHLIYSYKGREGTACYDNLKVEIQIRTRLQHAWATAVEAVGIFTGQALKSNEGSGEWLRFFALMGGAIAAMEGTPGVPGTPFKKFDLLVELAKLQVELEILDKMAVYRTTLQLVFDKKTKTVKYYVVELDFDQRVVKFRGFSSKQSQRANLAYTALERRIKEDQNIQVVLVSVDSVAALRRAYPNYFMDTEYFEGIVGSVLDGNFPDPVAPVTDPA